MKCSELPMKWKIGLSVALIATWVALVGISILKKEVTKEPPKTIAVVKTADEVVTKPTEDPNKYKIKALDGYTAYVFKYIDPEGKELKMINTIDTIRSGDRAYNDAKQAKDAEVFKDYFDVNGVYYFQVATGTTFAWRITPADTASITNWADNKGNLLLAVNTDRSTNSKIVERTVMLDYTTEIVQPTINETIK